MCQILVKKGGWEDTSILPLICSQLTVRKENRLVKRQLWRRGMEISTGSREHSQPRFGGRRRVMDGSLRYALKKVAGGSRHTEKPVQSPQSI